MLAADAAFERELRDWFASRIPSGWFVDEPEITYDDDEVLVVGRLAEPAIPAGATPTARTAALESVIAHFRRQSRQRRVWIAADARTEFGRHVSWGAVCGELREEFSTLTVPVMTRLRIAERATLDTLVEAGVARSRSEALSWCVRLVRANEEEWISQLRSIVEQVRQVRRAGPRVRQR